MGSANKVHAIPLTERDRMFKTKPILPCKGIIQKFNVSVFAFWRSSAEKSHYNCFSPSIARTCNFSASRCASPVKILQRDESCQLADLLFQMDGRA
jgi:hypothetical protein